jgi:hypothetical protein
MLERHSKRDYSNRMEKEEVCSDCGDARLGFFAEEAA